MRLYRLMVGGRVRYAGTQADARLMKRETGAAWTEIEMPIDKAGLLAFLNDDAASVPPPHAPPAVPVTPTSPPVQRALDATSTLARMNKPDLGIDAIVDDIARMRGG